MSNSQRVRSSRHCSLLLAAAVAVLPAVVFALQSPSCPSPLSQVTAFDAGADYFPPGSGAQADMQAVSAKLFNLSYHRSFKLLTIASPHSTDAYVLVPRGAPVPVQSQLPPAAQAAVASGGHVKYFTVPLAAPAWLETVQNGFVEALGLLNRSALFSSWSVSPCIQSALAANPALNADSVDVVTAGARADALFSSECCTDFSFPCSSLCPADTMAKFVYFRNTFESSMIASAEWMHVVAAFFNMECQSNALLSGIRARFSCSSSSALRASASSPAPVLSFVTARNTGGSWVYSFSAESKLASVAKSAGALLHSPSVSFTSAADFHSALAAGGVQHLVLREFSTSPQSRSSMLSTYGFSQSDAAAYSFLAHNVWKLDKLQTPLGSTDEFEGMLLEPDALLQELAAVLHPASALSAARNRSSFVWLRDVADDESVVLATAALCTAPNTARVSHAVSITCS